MSLSSLCSLAKATFSITTEAIVNELSVEGKLIYCFIYPYCFLSQLQALCQKYRLMRDRERPRDHQLISRNACDVKQNELDRCSTAIF